MTANGIDRTGVVGGSGGTRASFVDAFLDADTLADAYEALGISTFASEIASVTDYGAVGDGVTNEAAAFTAAAAVGKMVYVPDGTYLLNSNVASSNAAWLVGPNAVFTGSGELTVTRGFYADTGAEPQVWRFPDRARFGQGAHGCLNWGGGDFLVSDLGWIERDSALYSLSGRLAISGLAQTTLYTDPFPDAPFTPTAIGVSGLALNDDATDEIFAWGGYFEGVRNSGASATYGVEIDIGEFDASAPAPNPYSIGGSTTTGIQLASGGSTGNTPAAPAGVALAIATNGGTFRHGIIVNNDALDTSNSAIAMAKNHQIEWWNSSSNISALIKSSIATGQQNKQLLFTDTYVALGVIGGFSTFVFDFGTAAVNGFQFSGTASGQGAAVIVATGSDTDVDIQFTPKGAGVVRFGTVTGSADVAINGYVTIKDAAGNVRKLATIA